jgi:aconitate hydratase
MELAADQDAVYDRIVEIDLARLVPLAALPHSPDQIRPVGDLGEIEVQQVCIGSCTNSSYKDLVTVAQILKGKTVHRGVSLIMASGSKQVLDNLARGGYLADLLSAGARLMENACGFCIGNSQSPPSGGVSLRTSNRNFLGRSGTKDANIYLVSPETAAAAAITGRITDPRQLGLPYPQVQMPVEIIIDDSLIIAPDFSEDVSLLTIDRGPNIGEPPQNEPMPEIISGEATIKVGDNITTDHIIPAGDRMKYRSNIPKYAEYVFEIIDSAFPRHAKKIRDEGRHNIIIAGYSYGQGSSREHAAICPMYLGVKAVIAKSFERIHAANLVNFGILPLIFQNDTDYEGIDRGDRIEIADVRKVIMAGTKLTVNNLTKWKSFEVSYDLSDRQKIIVLAGGILNLR